MTPGQSNKSLNVRQTIPSLDGLRAVSILFVLLGHLYGTVGYPKTAATLYAAEFAHFGVTVFFVISGYLITTLLMREREYSGSIDLFAFYVRRSLRIMPAFLFFILALALANHLQWISLSLSDYVHAMTYTMNYSVTRSWEVGHLWSLSVEEQFYLLWPLAFARLTAKRAAMVAAAMFLCAPLIRALMHVMIPGGPARDLPIFPAVADAIAIGCLTALARERLLKNAFYMRTTKSPAMLQSLVLIFIVVHYGDYTIVDVLGTPCVLIAVAAVVESSTRYGGSLAGRLLNSRLIILIGTLSYSLYLWQQPFINRSGVLPANAFPLNLILACTCAVASFTLIERPLLGIRKRWASRSARVGQSPGTDKLTAG